MDQPQYTYDHIALTVSDLERSCAFYKAIGGQVVSLPSERFVEIILGELRLHLVRAPNGARAADGQPALYGIDHVCLRVSSLSALEALVSKLNDLEAPHKPYQIQVSPPLGQGQTHCEQHPPLATLYFRDPDGIGLEARCYSR